MSSPPDKLKQLASQKGTRPFSHVAYWAVCGIILFTLIADIAFLAKEGGKDDKPTLTEADFIPLLEAVHTAWTKIPANRVASPELKAFEKSRLELEKALAVTEWSKGLKKDAADKLQALANSMREDSAKLITQLSSEDSDLLRSMASVQERARKLMERAQQKPVPHWSQQVLTAYSQAIVALAKMAMDWPFVTIAGLVLLFAYADKMGGISKIFGGVQSIKIAGQNEIIFSPSQATERQTAANEVFASYRQNAVGEFAKLAKAGDIATRLKNVCEGAQGIKELLTQYTARALNIAYPPIDDNSKNRLMSEVDKRWGSLRFTVFVEDLLFENMLCQLIDYYPGNPGKGAGRAWSLRYGMIGRVWRMESSYSDISVTTNEEQLVTEWGMTRDEVRNFVSKKKTFTTVVLKDSNKPIALFYMDSDLEDTFWLNNLSSVNDREKIRKELHDSIEEGCKKFGLTNALQYVARKIENQRLNIRIESIRIDS